MIITTTPDTPHDVNFSKMIGVITNTPLINIPSNAPYLFIIMPEEMYNIKDIVETFRPNARVLSDVAAGRCKVIILFPHEGNAGSNSGLNYHRLSIVQEHMIKVGVDPVNVYLIHSNLRGHETMKAEGLTFNYIGMSAMENWNIALPGIPLPEWTGDKLFLCYNRQPREHRALLLAELIKHNLLHRGLASFNARDRHVGSVHHWLNSLGEGDVYHTLIPELITLYRTPMIIDVDTIDNLAVNLVRSHYEQSFLSLVTETLAVERDLLLLSEKTWKPIIIGHPFIILGTPGTLAKLREMGFQTFGKWIDESYDDFLPIHERVNRIVAELWKFNKMSTLSLRTIREEMKDVCLFNKLHFEKRRIRNDLQDNNNFVKVIHNIWNDLITNYSPIATHIDIKICA